LIVVLACALALVVSPAFDGYHLGCNTSAGDNIRTTHAGLLWCKHGVTPAEREEATAQLGRHYREEEERASGRAERQRVAERAERQRQASTATVPGTPSTAEVEGALKAQAAR